MKRIILFLSIIFAAVLYIEYQTEVLKEADNPDSVEFAITQEQESVNFDINTVADNVIAEFTELRTARDNTAVVVMYNMFMENFLDLKQKNNREGVPVHDTYYITTWKNKDVVYTIDNYNFLNYSLDNRISSVIPILLAHNSLAIIGSMPRGPTLSV